QERRRSVPVIGVVLMVAITVILAAAIGSSVFGQGPSESAPQANVDIIMINESAVKLEHLGGDTIIMNDSAVTRVMFATDTDSYTIDVENQVEAAEAYFDVGDTLTIELIDNSSGTPVTLDMDSGQFATVKIVDEKTKQLIADKELRF
ncbi:TPA: type IV pilin, partial [Methanosarcinaceae archaeon]|nr:type IV pilin [Methanosarcinaceae archaeon]